MMKTEKQVDAEILTILAKIKSEFPELLKYLPEMPVRNLDALSEKVTTKSLTDYYNSLSNLLEKYAMEMTDIRKDDG